MPTYTYRIPTDLGIGQRSTGISLASNEYISLMSVKAQNKYVEIQYNSLDRPGFEVGLCNSSKSLSERITSYAYSSSGVKDGTYMYFKNDAEYTPTENFLSLTGILYVYLKGSKYVNGSKVDAVSGDMSLKSYIDITLTTAYTISITTQVSPANTGSISSISDNYAGTVVNITATPATGYKFKNWSATAGTFGSTTSASTTYTFPSANATITATFEKNNYTLTTAVSPSGSGSVTDGGSLAYQSTKSLTATAATGYTFSGWTKTAGTLSSTTSNPTTFTMGAGNATVTANFTKNSYVLTTAVSPSGAGTVTAGSTLEYQATKSLTATPAFSYRFVSWSKTSGTLSSTSTNPTTFTMGIENATVTANFEVSAFRTLTTAVYPSNAGSVTSGGLVEIGADTQLTATPASGYVFDRWVCISGTFSNPYSSTATYTMPDEDVTVYATFKQSGEMLTAGRYNGSAYDAVVPIYYDGTDWIECDLKYYNGSNWVDSDTL